MFLARACFLAYRGVSSPCPHTAPPLRVHSEREGEEERGTLILCVRAPPIGPRLTFMTSKYNHTWKQRLQPVNPGRGRWGHECSVHDRLPSLVLILSHLKTQCGRERHPGRVKREEKEQGPRPVAYFSQSPGGPAPQALKQTPSECSICRCLFLARVTSFRNLNVSPIFSDWKNSRKNLGFWHLWKNVSLATVA